MFKLAVGTYTSGGSEGIYFFDWVNGNVQKQALLRQENPSWITAHSGKLYVANEQRAGSVSVLNGSEQPAAPDAFPTYGADPCHITVAGNWLYTANYGSGSLSMLQLSKDGLPVGEPELFVHHGSSVDKARQQSAHVHHSAITPDGRWLAVCDLGMDAVVFYPLTTPSESEAGSTQTGRIREQGSYVHLPPGTGPRHSLFPAGDIWYVIGELSCEIYVYKGFGCHARLLQQISVLTPNAVKSTCAALRVSQDGRLLIASARGADALALFHIDGGGLLTCKQILPCGGACPRDVAFSPNGSHLLCACQDSHEVTVFEVTGGGLSYLYSFAVPSPTCVCFTPV